jgi:kumamolisin
MSSARKSSRLVPLPGSERAVFQGARKSGKVPSSERITVTVIVRPRPTLPSSGTGVDDMARLRPSQRTYLKHEEFEDARGASREDLAAVERFARTHSLDVVQVDASRRIVMLSGTASNLGNAFGTELARYRHPTGTFRGRTGPIYLPTELAPIVQAVLGLDNRPQARPHFRQLAPKPKPPKPTKPKKPTKGAPKPTSVAYTPSQVAGLYDFPTGLDGTGQTVAILELGGGFNPQDLQTYFGSLGISSPSVTAVSVDGGTNSPTNDPNGPDGEVMLDIEVVGCVAPKADIVVYFAPNTDQGFIDGVTTAIHDQQHHPSVISISWGSAESTWTAQSMNALNLAFQDAASLGISVCVASGDHGSSDGVTDGLAHADFPASAPYALGCGGTRLESNAKQITGEAVWNDQPADGAGGGGVSDYFALPTWQSQANVPPSANPGHNAGRGVPDVSGDADPETGYTVRIDGTDTTIGGTSAVAPLWAGLIALLNQKLPSPVGYLNPFLYGNSAAQAATHDIVTGNNGAYRAGPGWDACSGWGSPDGAKLMAAL